MYSTSIYGKFIFCLGWPENENKCTKLVEYCEDFVDTGGYKDTENQFIYKVINYKNIDAL